MTNRWQVSWSEFYRGGRVDGNFGWLNESRDNKNVWRAGEAFNFMPFNGVYYGYVPPQVGRAPWNEDNDGWTVVCLAKNPKHKGIHVVGWYENAMLIGEYLDNPPLQRNGRRGMSLLTKRPYCIKSKSAFFIPPEYRTHPFSHPSVRQGKYSFLAGPGVKDGVSKSSVLKLLTGRLASLRGIAIHNPNAVNAPDPELDRRDPLTGFGTPEHRKTVERAAESAVVRYYNKKGFSEERVADFKCGYDYIFTKGSEVHQVEVKGTSTANEQFFLTRNEEESSKDAKWRLGMVTHALEEQPRVKIYTNKQFKTLFAVEPYVFVGKRIIEP